MFVARNFGISWTPIGSVNNPFKGTFNGYNHTISNLYINSKNENQGLFGYIEDGEVKNILIDGNVKSTSSTVALVAAKIKNSNIENIVTTSTSNIQGYQCVAGIVGKVEGNSVIKSCKNNAKVNSNHICGGIVADGTSDTLIVESCNTANIESNRGYCGGIAGCSTRDFYCYNTGNITGKGDDSTGYTSVGGIIGVGGYAYYCYNTGTIYGKLGQAAGIVGNLYGAGGYPVQNCYNVGSISNRNRANGAIIGESNYTNNKFCKWTTPNSANGYRGSTISGAKLTENDMKQFADTYFITDTNKMNNGYPILFWQNKSYENNYNVQDLSGNGYNLYFVNGTKIETDSNNKKYIFFDGQDDYVRIGKYLTEKVDLDNGFTIECEVKWNSFNNWSRIFEFGNGEDNGNFILSNPRTNSKAYFSISPNIKFEVSGINTNDVIKLKYVITKEENKHRVKLYKNEELVYENSFNYSNLNKNRCVCYIGKSLYGANSFFSGRLYNLKITLNTDNKVLIDYDLNR